MNQMETGENGTFVCFHWFLMCFRFVSHGYDLVELTKAQHQLSTYTDTIEHEEREAGNEDRKEFNVFLVSACAYFRSCRCVFDSFLIVMFSQNSPKLNTR